MNANLLRFFVIVIVTVNWLAQNEIKCGHVERELEEKKKLLEASRQKYKVSRSRFSVVSSGISGTQSTKLINN